MRIAGLVGAGLAILLGVTAQAAATPPPRLEVLIVPAVEAGEVAHIDVRLRVEGRAFAAGEPMLRLPMVFAATPTARYEAGDLDVSDAAGPLALTQTEDPVDPNNSIYFRRWAPARDTAGDITVRMRASGALFGRREGVGPPFNLMRQDGGFSGAGMVFIVTPDTQQPFRVAMRWDLSAMGEGARGVWSLGEGAVDTVGPADIVVHAYYMAGPDVRSFPARNESVGDDLFGVYWMGDTTFDMVEIGDWIVEAYAAMSSFFNTPDRTFRVFLRRNPAARSGGGGAGLVQSFMAGYGELQDVSVPGMRGLLAHEMVHNWTASLPGPVGAASWYGEGMAEHYEPHLTFRAGLLTVDEFIDNANSRARNYYLNALNTLPAADIAGLFWRDARARTLPYQRGSLYLAGVDAAMRAKSGGARSLDDLTLAMLARRDRGESYDEAAWVSLLRAELGEEAVAAFEAMMRGELLHPPSDAFGPCFESVETELTAYDLGFERSLLSLPPPVRIRGLQAGSPAEKAGLKDGDEVVRAEPPPGDAADDGSRPLRLTVKRDGRQRSLTIRPAARSAMGLQWRRTAGVSDEACNVWGRLPRP